ncbi:MAG: hypothetical protein MUC81_14320, partial [Bacteroidia bacterium]|nr:hypothetical protein [Bacteroidia bacterium]
SYAAYQSVNQLCQTNQGSFVLMQPGVEYEEVRGYRFGYNGAENDIEINVDYTVYAFEARIYDSRLGRFFSVDPLTAKYPIWSPYCFAGNSPIALIDYKGMGPDDPKHGESRKSGDCIEYWDEYQNDGSGAWVDYKPTSFPKIKIQFVKEYFIQNEECHYAGEPYDDCITSFNYGQNILHDNFDLLLGSKIKTDASVPISQENIGSGELLELQGLARKVIPKMKILLDAAGNARINGNLYNEVMKFVPNQAGYYVFAFSIGYGYHTMTLIVDKTDVNNVVLYSADQFFGWANRTTGDEDLRIEKFNKVANTYTNLAHKSYNDKNLLIIKSQIYPTVWLVTPCFER